jgi:glycosyltransferase involved in cell wall biosynthesis
LVIDDGSSDRSGRILDELASQDERLEVHHQENIGLTKSLNRGLALAKAPIVARHDADDISLPQRLQRQWLFFRSHPKHVVVGCCYDKIDASGQLLKTYRTRSSDFGIRLSLLDQNAIPHTGALFRTEPVMALGGYDEALTTAQDYDLWCRLGDRGKLANLPEVLVQRRIHAEQIGVQRRQDQLACRDDIRLAHRRRVADARVVGARSWYLRRRARAKLGD